MKSNRGVTLASLMIYVIGLIVIIGMMNTFVTYFYKNVDDILIDDTAEEQFSKFLSYITKDVNSEELTYIQSSTDPTQEYIVFKFSNGIEHQYIIDSHRLYFITVGENVDKKITLCKSVTNGVPESFTYRNKEIKINFEVNEKDFSTNLKVSI